MRTLLAVFIVFLAGCASFPNTKQALTPEGTFTYSIAGQSGPVIVLESGLSDDMSSWQEVVQPLSQFGQVLIYNRAGFHGSDSHSPTRDGKNIVAELKSLLENLQLPEPYLLVGHSLGGAYMELFAKTHPNKVSGVVLLDPNASRFTEQCQKHNLNYCEPPSSMPFWAEWLYPDAVSGEISGMKRTHVQINRAGKFPHIPLYVISAPTQNVQVGTEEKRRSDLYEKTQQEISQQSSISKFEVCQNCSHYVHHDQPERLINAVEWVISQKQKNN